MGYQWPCCLSLAWLLHSSMVTQVLPGSCRSRDSMLELASLEQLMHRRMEWCSERRVEATMKGLDSTAMWMTTNITMIGNLTPSLSTLTMSLTNRNISWLETWQVILLDVCSLLPLLDSLLHQGDNSLLARFNLTDSPRDSTSTSTHSSFLSVIYWLQVPM